MLPQTGDTSKQQQQSRGRGRRARGNRRPNRIKSNPPQHDRRPSQGRSRPLPLQRRDDAYSHSEQTEEHSFTNPYWEGPTHHAQDRPPIKIWWHAFNKDQLPHTFQPRECVPCGVYPPDPWAMIIHLTSMEHCDKILKSADESGKGRDSEREFRCEICQTEVRTRRFVQNHFGGRRHRNVLKILRKDLRVAGFSVPTEEELWPERRPSGASTRSLSTEERNDESRFSEGRHPEGRHSEGRHPSENRRNPRRGIEEELEKDRNQSFSRQNPIPPDPKTAASSSSHERVPSRSEDRRSEDDKNSQKHKYFVSSEEERSDDENLDISFEKPCSSGSKIVRETKPRVPLMSAKSLVDKRKAIISKLSNITDVRDLTKQLRQISGGRSQERSARKALPGIPYSDREIEQQETFGEARAQLVQTDLEPVAVEIEDDSDAGPAVKKESVCSNRVRSEEIIAEECTIMPSPPRPPPETISDSDTEEQIPSAPQRPPVTSESPIDPPNPQMCPNDFGKLAAIVAQERALTEKLRYLGQTLPCIEALLSQMRQEHQNALAQIDLLRAAKNRIVTGITQGPAPQQADIFNPNLILGALLQPTAPSGFTNMSWAAPGPNGNLSSYFPGLRFPESAMSPSVPSEPRILNGTCSAVLGTSSPASTSYAEPLAGASSSVPPPSAPAASSTVRERKRSIPRDSQTNESKRNKNTEFDEQLHSELILVVKLCGNHVYTSARDGIVKRTPLQDGAGSVILYKHSAEDSNSKLSKVWASMLEVVLHKKTANFKVLTGSNDCAIRVFDGSSGHLIKVVPVQARVQCGVIHWQKIYVGLKSGYIQVYNLADQRYIVESQHKQVPKLMSVNEIQNSKSIVVVTEENSVLIRDAGTLFVLHAIDRLGQEVKALMVRDDHILLCGTDKLFVFDKNAELTLTVDLTSSVLHAIPMKSGALLATTDGTLRSCKWKGIFLGSENVQSSVSVLRDSRAVVTAMDGGDGTSTVALATDSGRLIVVKLTSKSC